MSELATIEVPSELPSDELRDPQLSRRVNELRQADNWRNWFYLGREYVLLALVLAGSLAFYFYRIQMGLSWWWLIPAGFVATFLVGVMQHRLAMLGHEGSHYVLFRNRQLNEVASNWLCFYPLWSLTHNYRVQHFAHHQHVNDPELDPVVIEMMTSGNYFRYPMPVAEFIWSCVFKLYFWLPGLVRYTLVRARYATLGDCPKCYKTGEKRSLLVPALSIGYLIALLGSLIVGVAMGLTWLLAAAPVVCLAVFLIGSFLIPTSAYSQTKIKPVMSGRSSNIQRALFIAILLTSLAWLQQWTGQPWIALYMILWVVPLTTSFAYLMILREDIQHANTGMEGFSHTRNFRGNPLFKWIVFPYNMDYHLPHHLYQFVPHYNLPQLDDLLRETKVYQENAIVVDGYLLSHPDHA